MLTVFLRKYEALVKSKTDAFPFGGYNTGQFAGLADPSAASHVI